MRFISRNAVCHLVGFSKATLARKVEAGTFPKPVRVGFRVFWVEAEVLAWMEARVAERDVTMKPPE